MERRELSPGEAAFIAEMPKAELHVHLEGSIYPETLLRLARKHGRELPFSDVAGAREWFQFRDFPHFVEVYVEICQNLRDEEDYVMVTTEMAKRAAEENIRYLEVTYAPASLLNPRTPGEPDMVIEGLREGARIARDEHDVVMQFIMDPVRGRTAEEVMALAHWFDRNVGDGLVGFGLGGIEVGNPASRYREAFELARSAGGRISIHAGETVGPESVWDALETGAERIGHGVRSIEDPCLVEELVEREMLLEVSPTSNVRLGVVPSIEQHPFRQLHDAGVLLTVNSDDPPMFETTLTAEYMTLASVFGYTVHDLVELSMRAVDHAFLPDAERQRLRVEFLAEVSALATQYGVDAPVSNSMPGETTQW